MKIIVDLIQGIFTEVSTELGQLDNIFLFGDVGFVNVEQDKVIQNFCWLNDFVRVSVPTKNPAQNGVYSIEFSVGLQADLDKEYIDRAEDMQSILEIVQRMIEKIFISDIVLGVSSITYNILYNVFDSVKDMTTVNMQLKLKNILTNC